MGAERSALDLLEDTGWLLSLRGVEGCLDLLTVDGLPDDEDRLLVILSMLREVVGRVIKGMESAARDAEFAKGGA